MERKDVATAYKWKLEDIYETEEAWFSDYKRLENAIAAPATKYVGKLGEKSVLQEYFAEIAEISKLLDRL